MSGPARTGLRGVIVAQATVSSLHAFHGAGIELEFKT